MALFTSSRARVVTVAFLPAMILLLSGLSAGWWLAGQAQDRQAAAAAAARDVTGLWTFLGAVEAEQSSVTLGNGFGDRAATDRAAATGGDRVRAVASLLGPARRAVAADPRGPKAFAAYEGTIDAVAAATRSLASQLADPEAAATVGAAARLLEAAHGLRGVALTVQTAPGHVLDVPAYAVFAPAAAEANDAFDQALAALPPGRSHDDLATLLAAARWPRLVEAVGRPLAAGPVIGPVAPGKVEPALSDDDLAATSALAARAGALASDSASAATALAADRATGQLTATMIGVLALIAIAALCMIAAIRTGSRLGQRLRLLRDTASAAATRLPGLLDRIRAGETVDVDAEIPRAEPGRDEIGRIAALVDDAQRAAVGAAAAEASTRAGANAVFLNIAHRSQAVVHRQLQVLDEAERAENNSDQLARLFQLDHLATRERRNAENLIIMGGRQPRRQWRKPVPLADIVRSAVSESEQYTRITIGDMPEEFVAGAAVADLIHLFAELVDNATSFSPPSCAIEVQAGQVGRGVIVEIQDRGLGIEPQARERLNALLADPPDFGLLTLSADSRLGLFVVSRLAHRHGVRVTLRESAYGGVQALVLVPRALLVAATEDGGGTAVSGPGGRVRLLDELANATPADAGAPARIAAVPADVPSDLPVRGGDGAEADASALAEPSVPARDDAEQAVLPVRGADDADQAVLPERRADDAQPATLPVRDGDAEQAVLPARGGEADPADPRADVPGPAADAPDSGRSDAEVARPSPRRRPPAVEVPPALPERQPQEHLAAELRAEPPSHDEPDRPGPSARRSSAAMSALQRAGRNGRIAEPELPVNGDRP